MTDDRGHNEHDDRLTGQSISRRQFLAGLGVVSGGAVTARGPFGMSLETATIAGPNSLQASSIAQSTTGTPAYVGDAVSMTVVSGSSINLTIANNVSVGETIILHVLDCSSGVHLSTISDSRGNPWQLDASQTGSVYGQHYIYSTAVLTALATGADHILLTGTSSTYAVYAEIVSGLAQTNYVDQAFEIPWADNSGQSVYIVPTYSSDWIFSGFGINAPSNQTITFPNGFAPRGHGQVGESNSYFASADILAIAGPTGSQLVDWKIPSSFEMSTLAVAYRPAGTFFPPSPIVQCGSSGPQPQTSARLTAVLGRPPTPGNLLLALYGGMGDGGSQIGTQAVAYATPPAGFTELCHPCNINQSASANSCGIGVAYRTVESGDGTTWNFPIPESGLGTPSYTSGAIVYELAAPISAKALYFTISQFGQLSTAGTPIGESLYNVPAGSVILAAATSDCVGSSTTPSAFASSSPGSPGMRQDQLIISPSLNGSLVVYRDTSDTGTVTGNVTSSATYSGNQGTVQVLVAACPTPIVAPQIIQSAYFGEDSTLPPWTATLPQVPTPGNLLVMFFGGQHLNNTRLAPPAGMMQLVTVESPPASSDGMTTNQLAAAYRIVQTGDGTAWSCAYTGLIAGDQSFYSSGCYLVEIANANPAAPSYVSSSGTGVPYGQLTKNLVASTSLLLAACCLYTSPGAGIDPWFSAPSATPGWFQIGSVTGTLGDFGSLAVFAAQHLTGNVTAAMQPPMPQAGSGWEQWAALLIEIPSSTPPPPVAPARPTIISQAVNRSA